MQAPCTGAHRAAMTVLQNVRVHHFRLAEGRPRLRAAAVSAPLWPPPLCHPRAGEPAFACTHLRHSYLLSCMKQARRFETSCHPWPSMHSRWLTSAWRAGQSHSGSGAMVSHGASPGTALRRLHLGTDVCPHVVGRKILPQHRRASRLVPNESFCNHAPTAHYTVPT